jgi:HAD superfamily hydrolase (TIGR01509 family)
MQWIHHYQLFLFDFDGLLVNTEEMHYLAYVRMCERRGVALNWDFDRYCRAAHYRAEALKEQVYVEFPELLRQEPNWAVLYEEKRKAMLELLREGAAHLMPGVKVLLETLQEAKIPSCVVTHSPDELISLVRKQNPVLNTIPFWITREQYSQPKPHPECYFKAIETHAGPNDRIIGFEDTPRGLSALSQTRALPVLICQAHYPEIPDFLAKGAKHFPTLEAITDASL